MYGHKALFLGGTVLFRKTRVFKTGPQTSGFEFIAGQVGGKVYLALSPPVVDILLDSGQSRSRPPFFPCMSEFCFWQH